MCGICGKLNYDRLKPTDPILLKRMMKSISHRGPDGSGSYISGPICLGHQRLSIIDLNTGNQPMCNEDGTIWLVYNGEIYNFINLRNSLIQKGHIFKSTTDTEVIIHLYEEYGQNALKEINGMFAFALWDANKNLLLLARDRIGIKPLYYSDTGDSIVFGSEIKALLCDNGVKQGLNYNAIDRFLTYFYLPSHETLFKHIVKLDPGHYLKIQNGKKEIKEYWDLNFVPPNNPPNFHDSIDQLDSLLSHTVKAHMISDVPVGILLSGGVDSTGVLRYAANQTDKPIHTFTIGFKDGDVIDERPFAKQAAAQYNTIHDEMTISADQFQSFLPGYVWHMEEPVCEPPAIALYYLADLARKSSVKVLLSGEGGDEAFGGYQNYRNLLILESMKSFASPYQNLLRKGFNALSQIGLKRFDYYGRIAELPLSQYYLSRTSSPYSPLCSIKNLLYAKDFASLISSEDVYYPTRKHFLRVRNESILNQMLYVDSKTWLPDDLLVKADKMTMASSVELRVPLLDFKVFEFAASLPDRFKIHKLSTKRILKAVLEPKIPTDIIKRKKTGFPVPYFKWLRHEMKELVCDYVLDRRNWIGHLFQKRPIEKLVAANQRGEGFDKEVFSLLVLAIWFETFKPHSR